MLKRWTQLVLATFVGALLAALVTGCSTLRAMHPELELLNPDTYERDDAPDTHPEEEHAEEACTRCHD